MSLSPFELAHAKSILEPATVEPLPPDRRYKVLVGSVVRKNPHVIAAFLRTLAWQRLRAKLDVSYHFITDYAPMDEALKPLAVLDLLENFKKDHEVTLEHHGDNKGGDYGEGTETRQWQPTAWHRVGALKNRILQHVLSGAFDACWLVDADVLCDPTTLQSLWDTREPIVAGVYWTHWQKPNQYASGTVHAGPQVWLRHPYQLSGRGYTEAEFRDVLIRRGKVRVWGLGACTLIHRGAIEKGVNFSPAGTLPPGPMSDGEDRHFCWKADALHLPMYADAWPDIYHAYHPEEYGEIDRRLEQLNTVELLDAVPGQLVSAVLRNLEQPDVPPEFVRGRIGTLGVLPEIEEAIASLTVGESKLVRVHFPVEYGFAPYRGQTRIFHVELLDAKPYRLPPVIDSELLWGSRSGSTIDAITLNGCQLSDMVAAATAI